MAEACEAYEEALAVAEAATSPEWKALVAPHLCANRTLGGDSEGAHAYARAAVATREEMPAALIWMDFERLHETEALLRDGDEDLAREGVRRFGERVGGDGRKTTTTGRHTMKLTVFGPTGPTGEQIVRKALASGHQVTAMARRPEAVAPTGPRLRVVYGDVLAPSSVREGVVGADAVLSALGSRQMGRPTKVYSAGTAAVLAAMREADIRRFVGVSAVPVGPEDQKSALERYLVHPLLHRFFGGGYDDMRRMEEVLAASELDWTIFRPPQLTNAAATGRYRTAVDGPLPRAWRVSRADLAAAMLAAVKDPALVGHAVTIAA